jgi:hypothetical protein
MNGAKQRKMAMNNEHSNEYYCATFLEVMEYIKENN